ncbi:DUF167 domain-containing protein [Patescibacteria group bacterium]
MEKYCLLVQVTPGSRESRVFSYCPEENLLRVKLKARPEKGAANRELIEVMSKTFNIPKAQIGIRVGHKTKRKLVCFERVSVADIQGQLAKI